jgi:hypothetical protein
VPRSRNPVGDFNTAGQGKCNHCGDWFPENWVASHIANCPKNPANQTEQTNEEESQ